jgi:hypothetical protein
MKSGGIIASCVAIIALVASLAFDVQADAFKIQLLGRGTAPDAIAVGSNGGHVILHKGATASAGPAVYYDDQIGANGKVTRREQLPFPIWEMLALAVDSQNEPHLLYWSLNGNYLTLKYASVASGKWFTQAVPNPGCGFIEGNEITSIAVDSTGHAYIPCIWQQSAGVNFASLIIFDGQNWSRADVATNRFDSSTDGDILPENRAFVAVDSNDQVHLGYGLATSYIPIPISSYGVSICDSVGQQGTYTENCYTPESAYSGLVAMAVGPSGDSHFLYGSDQTYYLHFDGSSWTNELLTNGSLYLVVNSNDIPAIVYTSDTGSIFYYSVRTPGGWQSQPIVEVPFTLFGFQVALNSAAGLPYIASTADDPYAGVYEGFYVFLSAPDLAATWNDIALTTTASPRVLAHLKVLNDGNATASGYDVTCFLSDTSTPSESDPVIAKATVSLAAGASRVLNFSFDPANAPSGKYLVAQIATKSGEANPNNNTAAILIP